jgi:hypothetical protein
MSCLVNVHDGYTLLRQSLPKSRAVALLFSCRHDLRMLPPEIVNYIVQYIWPLCHESQLLQHRAEPKHTLSALAFTCSTFTNVIQPYLYRSLHFKTTHDCEEFFDMNYINPHLGLAI